MGVVGIALLAQTSYTVIKAGPPLSYEEESVQCSTTYLYEYFTEIFLKNDVNH